MKKSLFFALGLMIAFGVGISAPQAHALSCLSLDMYLDAVAAEEGGETMVFTGTATAVTKNHTQVVTVTEAHKGWVAPKMWVQHPYSNDWQYYCSNGPAAVGKSTVFFVTVDPYGSFSAVQTLDANSSEAKAFIDKLEKAETDAGVSEATAQDRASEVMESVKNVLTALINLLGELSYWQSQAK